MWSPACHESSSAGGAGGVDVVGGETDPASCQSVQVRCGHTAPAPAGVVHVGPTHVVHQDEDNVGTPTGNMQHQHQHRQQKRNHHWKLILILMAGIIMKKNKWCLVKSVRTSYLQVIDTELQYSVQFFLTSYNMKFCHPTRIHITILIWLLSYGKMNIILASKCINVPVSTVDIQS